MSPELEEFRRALAARLRQHLEEREALDGQLALFWESFHTSRQGAGGGGFAALAVFCDSVEGRELMALAEEHSRGRAGAGEGAGEQSCGAFIDAALAPLTLSP